MANSEQRFLDNAAEVSRLRKEIEQHTADKSKNDSDRDASKARSEARQTAAREKLEEKTREIKARYTAEKAAIEKDRNAGAKIHLENEAELDRKIRIKKKKIAHLVGATAHLAPPSTNHALKPSAVPPSAAGNKSPIIQNPKEMKRIHEEILRHGGKVPSHVIPHPEHAKWIVLSCQICGANAGRGAKNTFRGIKGVVTHLRMTHKSAPQVVSKALNETLRFCHWRLLTGQEYKALCCRELVLEYGDPAKQDVDSSQDEASENDNDSGDDCKDEKQVNTNVSSRQRKTEAAGANPNTRHMKVTRDHPLSGQGNTAQGVNPSICKTSATMEVPKALRKVDALPRMEKEKDETKSERGIQAKKIAHISRKPEETTVFTADRYAPHFEETPSAMKQGLRREHGFALPEAVASARNKGESGKVGKVKPNRVQIEIPTAVCGSRIGAPKNDTSKVPKVSQEAAGRRDDERPARRNSSPVIPFSSAKLGDRQLPQDSEELSRRRSDFTLLQASTSIQRKANLKQAVKIQPVQVQAPSGIFSNRANSLACKDDAQDPSIVRADNDVLRTSNAPLERCESPTASLTGEPTDGSVLRRRSVTQREPPFVPRRFSEDDLVLHGADKISLPVGQSIASAVPVKAADSVSGPTPPSPKVTLEKSFRDIFKPLPENFLSSWQGTLSTSNEDGRESVAPAKASSLLHNSPFTAPTAPMLSAGSSTMTGFPDPLNYHWRHVTKVGNGYFMCECNVCSANAYSSATYFGMEPFSGLVRLARHVRDHHNISETSMENLDEWCHRVSVSQEDAVLMRKGKFFQRPQVFWKLGDNGTNLRSPQYRNQSPTRSRESLTYRGSRPFTDGPSGANSIPLPRTQVAGRKHARDSNGVRLSPPHKRQGSRP